MAEITPGKWEKSESGIIGCYIEGRHNWTHVADVNMTEHIDPAEAQANLNAIARAPDLLKEVEELRKALTTAIAIIESFAPGDRMKDQKRKLLDALLQRGEG